MRIALPACAGAGAAATDRGDDAPFVLEEVDAYEPPPGVKNADHLSEQAEAGLLEWCKLNGLGDFATVSGVVPAEVADRVCSDPAKAPAEVAKLLRACNLNCTIVKEGGKTPLALDFAYQGLYVDAAPSTLGEAKAAVRDVVAAIKLGFAWGRRYGPTHLQQTALTVGHFGAFGPHARMQE